MTKIEKLALMKDRYNKLNASGKNVKSPGTLNKIKRQIRNIEK